MIFDLSTLNGKTGFAIHGSLDNGNSGHSVSAAGDFNGDGIADLIIGAPSFPGNDVPGNAYVVLGRAGGYPGSLELGALGSNGFTILGEADGDRAGLSVGAAGDVNGDGFDDIVVGAMEADGNDGAAYVVFGTADGLRGQTIALADIRAGDDRGFVMTAAENDEQAGRSVAGAGDVNGDGHADIVIGANEAGDGSYAGAAHVVFGRADGIGGLRGETVDLGALGTAGFTITGPGFLADAGASVDRAGDVNGDGIDDIIVGASLANVGTYSYSGAAFVVYGKEAGLEGQTIDLASFASGADGFIISGSTDLATAGWSVSAAGDVNGDGLDDVVVGQPNLSEADGSAYVVFGKAGGHAETIELGSLGTAGFAVTGAAAFDRTGVSVSGAGDIDGDGFADILVGAPPDAYDVVPGTAYLIFGRPDGANGLRGRTIDLAQLTGKAGLAFQGTVSEDPMPPVGDLAGYSLSDLGDVNGDGADDFIIGAPYSSPGEGWQVGTSYVIYGTPPEDDPETPAANPPPIAADDAYAAQRNTPLTVAGPGLLANDRDPDGDPLAVTGILEGPAHGTLAWQADGSFVYRPHSGFAGTDSFVYRLEDGDGDSDTAAATITVWAPPPVERSIAGGFGPERLAGAYGNDTVLGMGGNDTIAGDGGRDQLYGNTGDDLVDGGPDEDLAWGGQGNDALLGGAGNDWVLGDRGHDLVHGGAGRDSLWGGQGDDGLFGDRGQDLLHGDRGNDWLTGGPDADQFVFADEGGFDRITDFDPGDGDLVRLVVGADGLFNGIAIGSIGDLLSRLVDGPDGAVLALGDDQAILFAGVAAGRLSADDFQIV